MAFETAEGTAPSVAAVTRAATTLAAAGAVVALGRAASFVLTAAHVASTVAHHCRPCIFVFAPVDAKVRNKMVLFV